MWLNAAVPPTSEGARRLLGGDASSSLIGAEGFVLVREYWAAALLPTLLSLLRKHEEADGAPSRFLQVLLEHVIVRLEESIHFSLGPLLLPHFQSYLLSPISIAASIYNATPISIVRHVAEWRKSSTFPPPARAV